MSQPAIRHLWDRDRYFNGELGAWTNCGIAFGKQPDGVVTDCPDCVRLDRERLRRDDRLPESPLW